MMDPLSFIVALNVVISSVEKNQQTLQECVNFTGNYSLEGNQFRKTSLAQDEKSIRFAENEYAYLTTQGIHEVKNELGEIVRYQVQCFANRMTIEFFRYVGTRKDYAAMTLFKSKKGFVLKTSSGAKQKWLATQEE